MEVFQILIDSNSYLNLKGRFIVKIVSFYFLVPARREKITTLATIANNALGDFKKCLTLLIIINLIWLRSL